MNASQIKTAKTSELVAFYNTYAAKPVNKFADRATAEKRVAALIASGVTPIPTAPKDNAKDNAKDPGTVNTSPMADIAKTLSTKAPSAPAAADEPVYRLVKSGSRGSMLDFTEFLGKFGATFTKSQALSWKDERAAHYLRWSVAHEYIEVVSRPAKKLPVAKKTKATDAL